MTVYLPKVFQGVEWQRIVNEHPLATVISQSSHGLQISHLPLLLEAKGDGHCLLGHLARMNPQSRVMDGQDCTVIFHGPQAYISPLWYKECDVPTWNYLVVHFQGQARLLPEEEAVSALRKLAERMESDDGWRFAVPDDLKNTLHQQIAAFEIVVKSCQVKFKLSQNRKKDQAGVIVGLEARGDANSVAVAGWMRESLRDA